MKRLAKLSKPSFLCGEIFCQYIDGKYSKIADAYERESLMFRIKILEDTSEKPSDVMLFSERDVLFTFILF